MWMKLSDQHPQKPKPCRCAINYVARPEVCMDMPSRSRHEKKSMIRTGESIVRTYENDQANQQRSPPDNTVVLYTPIIGYNILVHSFE
jgi:hypothetical protein